MEGTALSRSLPYGKKEKKYFSHRADLRRSQIPGKYQNGLMERKLIEQGSLSPNETKFPPATYLATHTLAFRFR